MQMQNYMDIGKDSVANHNLSRNKASPSRFTGGGARGWVPIKGRANFASKTKITAETVIFMIHFSKGTSFIKVSPSPI